MVEEKTLYEDDNLKVSRKAKDTMKFPSGYSTVWFGPLTELVLALKPRELRVFFEVAKLTGYQNKIDMNVEAISKITGIQLNHVYTDLKALRGLDVIRKTDDGYLMNPEYFWRGKQPEFWQLWHEWRKIKRSRKVMTKLR